MPPPPTRIAIEQVHNQRTDQARAQAHPYRTSHKGHLRRYAIDAASGMPRPTTCC
jgi:hypothetical protein